MRMADKFRHITTNPSVNANYTATLVERCEASTRVLQDKIAGGMLP